MKLSVYFLFFLMVMSFSCEKSKNQNEIVGLSNISTEEWDNVTLNHVREYCDLESHEYDTLMPAIINKKGDTLNILMHLKNKLNYRNKFIQDLRKIETKKNNGIDNNLIILESYKDENKEQKPYFIVYFENNKKVFHFSLDSKSKNYVAKEKQWENPSEFKLIEEGNLCLNEMKKNYPMNLLEIKSKLIFKQGKKINYKTEYVYLR